MSLYIEDYSERAIALFGDTKLYKAKIMDIGGKYNPSLKVSNSDDRRAGFIFPKSKKVVVQQLIDDVISGSIQPEEVGDKGDKGNYTKSSSSYTQSTQPTKSNVVEVSKADFMNLLSKVERLEQEVNNLKLQLLGKNVINSKPKGKVEDIKEESKEDEDEDEEEEVTIPKKRLLRRKN